MQGGSTITQQYVKNAYVGSDRTVVRKLREARMAAQLEHHWSKDRILEAYLNTIYLGAGAYGVEAAAHRYFAKPASDLSLSESALLAGLIPAPERWAPFADDGGAELRRRYVIDRMQALGFVDAPTAAEARLDRPLVTEPELTALRYPWFVDAVRRYLVTEYGERAVYSGGLRVHTSLDPEMQTAAESVMAQTLGAPGDPHGAIVSVDHATGYVRALVGGRDGGEERFNIAIQGLRQPGSAFSPSSSPRRSSRACRRRNGSQARGRSASRAGFPTARSRTTGARDSGASRWQRRRGVRSTPSTHNW